MRVEVPVMGVGGAGGGKHCTGALCNLQLSINIIRVIKSWRLGGVEHVECTHG